MDGQTDVKAAEVAEIFTNNQNQLFPILAKTLRERLNVSAKDLSMKLHKHRSYITKVEAGECLACGKDIKPYMENLGINDGFAGQFTQRWQANYETGIKKVFADHSDDPFPVFFRVIRGTIGIATDKMSKLLGKHDSYISQIERAKNNIYFSEEHALKSVKIFRLDDDLAEEFMAKWKNHYQIG